MDLKQGHHHGSSQWDGHALAKDPNFFGAWYISPGDRERNAFEARFQVLMGHKPHRLASLAYDAVAMVVTLFQVHRGAVLNMADITQATGFSGLDGLFRLLPSGVNERHLNIYTITPSGPSILKMAPKTFTRLN